MKKLKKALSNQKGVATIEFALTIGIFLAVTFMIFELARVTYLSASWDLAITESVRLTKNQLAPNNDYKALFAENLRTQLDKRWGKIEMAFLAAKGEATVDVQYADTIQDVSAGHFRIEPTPNDSPKVPAGKDATIAVYSLNYKYQFLTPLPLLPQSWLQSVFNRKIIMVQEYERSSFRF